ncbi:MAG TPA: hypothetical protein VHO70_24970 [Chitinispirillaceae bacterium]|nr:hypothetical protein [Chitinispirillaceae bacterium]
MKMLPGTCTGSQINFFGQIAAFSVLVLFISCAPSIRQYYPDTFHSEDNIYENRALHFLLIYRGNWQLYTDPKEMDKTSHDFAAHLNKRGAELLFSGSTTDGLYGSRGIAINLNEPALDYAKQVRELNKNDVRNDSGIVEFYAGTYPMAKWTYSIMNFRFVEFFFNVSTYDVRIAFWTKEERFTNFLPVLEDIISSVSFTHGM